MDVGRGDVEPGSALAAVEAALVTVCVTCVACVACVAALFALVVTACVTGVADDGKALDSAATGPAVASTPVAPRSS